MKKQDILERASTLEWNVGNLEEVLDKLNLTLLERWVLDGKLDALRLSIKMLKREAGGDEEDTGS